MRWLLTFTLSGFAAFLLVALSISVVMRGARPALPVTGDLKSVYVQDIDCQKGFVPAPFVCEDRIDQRQISIRDRVVWWQSPLADGDISYAYRHGDNPSLEFAALPANDEPLDAKLFDAADLLNKLLLMLLGIVIIAKGRDPRLAYPAGIFLYGMAAGSGITSTLVGLPWWLIVFVQSLRQVLLGVSLYGLFFLATELSKHAYSDRVRRLLNATGAVFIVVVIVLLIGGSIVYPLQVYPPDYWFVKAFYGLPVVAKIVPLLIMAYALARENTEDVVLLRWIFASTLIGFSGPLVKETSSALGAGDPSFGPLVLTESLMGFGYGYALIKSRLVDINFVLNRAAVFAALASIVAIGFELVNDVLSTEFRQKRGVAYALVLLLGISLNYLRPKIESLFRRLASAHRASFEEGLATLIADCRRMKNVDDVMTVSVNQLRHLAGVRACALYERQSGQLVRVALDESVPSSTAFPMHLADDDQVCLRIADARLGTDAASGAGTTLVTALPATSTSFPMSVSDELIGVISIDPLPEQPLHDPDVRRDLSAFAHELGTILAFKRSQYCTPSAAEVPAVSRLSPA